MGEDPEHMIEKILKLLPFVKCLANINKSLDKIQSSTLSDMLTKVWLEVVFVNEELGTNSHHIYVESNRNNSSECRKF